MKPGSLLPGVRAGWMKKNSRLAVIEPSIPALVSRVVLCPYSRNSSGPGSEPCSVSPVTGVVPAGDVVSGTAVTQDGSGGMLQGERQLGFCSGLFIYQPGYQVARQLLQ